MSQVHVRSVFVHSAHFLHTLYNYLRYLKLFKLLMYTKYLNLFKLFTYTKRNVTVKVIVTYVYIRYYIINNYKPNIN